MQRTGLLLSALTLFTAACGDEPPAEVSHTDKVIMGSPTVMAPAPPAPVATPAPAEAEAPDLGAAAPLHIALEGEPPPGAKAALAPKPKLAPIPKGAVTQNIKIASGESLGRLSTWSGLSIESLAAHNDLDPEATLQIGQPLRIPLKGEALAVFAGKRHAFAQGRVDRFLKKKGGLVEIQPRKIRRGDRATKIARKHGLPLWVLMHYNPDVNLDRLAIGDSIQVPITRQ